MGDDLELEQHAEEAAQLSERELRQSAAYQKHRLTVVGVFVISILAAGIGFTPVGELLGGMVAGIFDSMVADGAEAYSAGRTILLSANGIGLAFAFLLSFFVGPRVPSGFPHVVLGILVPLSLATMQATFFELTDGAGGLVDTDFARWSFVAMFIITLVIVESGVTLGRRRLEKQAA